MLTTCTRRVFLSLAASCLLAPASASAQELNWAQKMFDTLNIDFGNIARGSDARFRVKITNIYKDDVHISSVRTTCGCSAASPSTNLIKSGETAFVEVKMDTLRFSHRKTSNVIVTIDAPNYQEIRIPITSYIRTDVVFSPGSANFGPIEHGQDNQKTIELAYAGRNDWAVREIISNNENLTVKAVETTRENGRVGYNLQLTLKPGTPIGKLREQIYVVTNDVDSQVAQGAEPAYRKIPLLVEATIEADITIAPQIVSLGMMTPGKEKTVNVVIRGRKPFAVEKIECESDLEVFKVRLPKTTKPVHVLPLTVIPPNTPGTFSEKFTVTIVGRAEPLTFKAYGKISGTVVK